MDGVRVADHQTGVAASIAGIDGDGGAFDIAEVNAAQCPNAQSAVWLNAAHHQPQCVSVGAEEDGFAVVLALQSEIGRAAAIVGDAMAEHGGITLQHRAQLHIIAHRAGGFHQGLKAADQKVFVDLEFHIFSSYGWQACRLFFCKYSTAAGKKKGGHKKMAKLTFSL